MAQPNPYAKATDFTEYQTEHQSAPFSGALLDAELVDIELNLQGLNANIALIQRDDGELANEVVGVAALGTDVLALIASETFSVEGTWATATLYAVGDIVEKDAAAYLCLVAHTSGTFATDLTAVKWVDLTGAAAALDATLTTIGNLTGAANKMIYFTGVDVAALADLTAAGRALLDDANADAQLTTLGGTTVGKALFIAATAAAARSAAGAVAIAGDNLTGGLNDKSSTVASDTAPDIFAVTVGGTINYTGTATCTGFTAAPQAGAQRLLVCADAAVFTAGANLLIDGVQSGSNYTAQAGDKLLAIAVTTTQFRLTPLPYGAWRDDGAVVANATDPTKKVRISAASVATATTRVLTMPNADLTLPNAATLGTIPMTTAAGALGMRAALNKGIYGLTYANGTDATNDIDIAAGGAMDATGAYWMTLAATLTKQSDVAWAVGSAAGGLDTGAVGNSDYYIWLIARSDTGVVDALYSLSSTAPTMPANYDYKRLIGWIKRVGGTIVAFDVYETAGGGIRMMWDSPTLDVNLANTLTTSRRTDAVKVPLNFATYAHLNLLINDAADSLNYIYSPDSADLAPSATVTPLATLRNAGGNPYVTPISIQTSATGTIAARSDTATVNLYAVVTLGFDWGRRN